ncbi:MAG: phosphoribosylaminoimidazolecarboxamide formyltransferase / IMP cyclohydrolase [Rhodospirillaceae bacterium]|nr:MAG: phosphoribosylaminoimidazolecarboxamide formyltransferase / IMP cyclohydrolase [Rhodospirillaceae bacterium]
MFESTPPTPIRRALLSVSDKTGLVPFARFLTERGVHLLSTGGTAAALREADLAVTEVADYTGFPEMLEGRLKTLHPRIHGGLLGRRDKAEHRAAMAEHGILPIDLLVVTLYPFEQTVATNADAATCIERIDIGGPALIRAAAKNHGDVTVLVDPNDYAAVTEAMTHHDGATPFELRRRLAATAYARTAAYDAAIAAWFDRTGDEALFPARFSLTGALRQTLRYGENPHQRAAFYAGATAQPGLATAVQVQGKELSYNNLCDTDAAIELAAAFDVPAVAIIKHANPCGCAVGSTLKDAYLRALACDPVSAFGGIVAVNRTLEAEAAAEMVSIFTEVVVAPAATPEARALFAGKKNLRLLLTGGLPDPREAGFVMRSVGGGFLLQTRDTGCIARADLKVVTQRAPTERELDDLLFGWTVCKHVKSNAIVFVRDRVTVGVGAGQMSRVDSVRIAAWKAAETAHTTVGSVVASDAFFPFPDGLIAACDAGATAAIQPGGSVRDAEVIAAADARNMAMVFTGMRHFRH